MLQPRWFTRTPSALLTLVTLTAACSTDPSRIAAPVSARSAPLAFDVIPTPADVVVAGPDGGAFGAPFLANNSGRATSEFWDNASVDDTPGNIGCNAGFFAAGTMAPGCLFAAPGSYANRGGYNRFFGKGAGLNAAPAFTFSGALTYTLKLEGTYTAGEGQTVGFFYKNAQGQYVLTPIAAFGARTVNATATITPTMTGGHDWGLFITNDIINEATGCVPDRTHCSDATGSFDGTPRQQFALFVNAAGTKYLVGIEDNRLELLGTGPAHDADYNDFLISVTPASRVGGAGCSPGSWKNTNAANWATAGYSQNATFASVFGNDAFGTQTLRQVLANGGGGLNALGRQTVGALLNAGALGSSFELTPSGVIARFNSIVPSSPGSYGTLQSYFEGYTDVNGRACPLNNGRG